jgi:hypothetical protein
MNTYPVKRGKLALEASMTAGSGNQVADGGHGKTRAADIDRDRVAGILGTAYSEGRLSKDEYDARLEAALSARTYADLDQLMTDLPVPRATASLATESAIVTPADRTNGLAVASLALGFAQFAVGPLATIPAIVLGHMARSQIRRTGERGSGLALAGLALGWGAVVLGIIGVFLILTIAIGTSTPMPTP